MPESIIILGLLRSGTTVLADLLTDARRSVVFSEPMLMHGWAPQTAVIPKTQEALGLQVTPLPDDPQQLSAVEWFDETVLPTLGDLDFWGMKEVHFSLAEALVDHYRPDHLVLTVRDPRDVFLSSLDLVNKALLVFSGQRVLRDEAWVYMRLRSDSRVLSRLYSRNKASLLRYEDQREGDDWADQLSRLVGRRVELSRRVALTAVDRGRKLDEADKHGMNLSFSSFFRWTRHDDPRTRAMAHWLWRDLHHWFAPFGYQERPELGQADPDVIRAIASPYTADMARTTRLPDAAVEDEAQFLLALRAGRRRLASLLPVGARVMEFDPLTPGLKYLNTKSSYGSASEYGAQRLITRRPWRRGDLGFARLATHLVFNHVFEFDPDWAEALARLVPLGKPIFFNTFLGDERPPWWGDVDPPTVNLVELHTVVRDHRYQMTVSARQAYGARLIMLRPTR